MPLSDAGSAAALDSMFGDGKGTPMPSTVYVALSTTNPTTSVTEPSGANGYARQAVTNNSTNWPNVSTPVRTKKLATLVTFSVATPAGWGTISHYALYTAVTGGTMLASGALTTPQVVGVGDIVTIQPNTLTVTVT